MLRDVSGPIHFRSHTVRCPYITNTEGLRNPGERRRTPPPGLTALARQSCQVECRGVSVNVSDAADAGKLQDEEERSRWRDDVAQQGCDPDARCRGHCQTQMRGRAEVRLALRTGSADCVGRSRPAISAGLAGTEAPGGKGLAWGGGGGRRSRNAPGLGRLQMASVPRVSRPDKGWGGLCDGRCRNGPECLR